MITQADEKAFQTLRILPPVRARNVRVEFVPLPGGSMVATTTTIKQTLCEITTRFDILVYQVANSTTDTLKIEECSDLRNVFTFGVAASEYTN